MGSNADFRGIWIYRSLANTPGTVGSFDKLKVWEAELYVEVGSGNRIHGHIGERPEVATGSEPYLTIEGEVVPGDPSAIRWRARGRLSSEFEGWVYDYVGYFAPQWPDAPRQRPAIVGTVTRTVAHGNAPAGSVFSFVAIKSDFLEPRDVIPLAKPVIDLMASAEHRHHHALWHAARDEWAGLSEPKRDALRRLGWQPGPNGRERPSLSPDRLANGSGEDFLYMHRRMLRDVRALDPAVRSWSRVPQPRALASFAPGARASLVGNPDGFAVPPAWVVPGDPDTTNWLAALRETSTLYSKFQAWEAQYTDPRFLADVSLGELGSRIEFTIHNWMHMRWASVPRDPSTDKGKHGLPIPGGRDSLDFDEKWLRPEYDYLGETFSSHVNPVFWRLHGWVDDRIEDWFRAQETARPGVVRRKSVGGVDWFEPDGKWVVADEPWEGPVAAGDHGGGPHSHVASGGEPSADGGEHAGHDHGHQHGSVAHRHGGAVLDVATMQDALRIIFGPEPSAVTMTVDRTDVEVRGLRRTWFRLIQD